MPALLSGRMARRSRICQLDVLPSKAMLLCKKAALSIYQTSISLRSISPGWSLSSHAMSTLRRCPERGTVLPNATPGLPLSRRNPTSCTQLPGARIFPPTTSWIRRLLTPPALALSGAACPDSRRRDSPRSIAAQDEGEWRRTAEQGAEHFMAKWITAKKNKAGLRHAVVCPNVTESTKERIGQSKRTRAGSLALVD